MGATLVPTDHPINTELMALKCTLPSAGSLRGRAKDKGEGYGDGECLSECSPLCLGLLPVWDGTRLKPSQHLKSSITKKQAGGMEKRKVFETPRTSTNPHFTRRIGFYKCGVCWELSAERAVSSD